MSEHRRETRQRTFLKGRIIFNKGASTMDCLVRDMSSSGARLALTETTTLPEAFDLYIPQKEKTYRATMCWRRADGVGINFVDEASPAPVPAAVPGPVAAPPLAPAAMDDSAAMLALVRRIGELEAENAVLRRLLASQPASAA